VHLVHLTLNDLHYYYYGPSGAHYLSSYIIFHSPYESIVLNAFYEGVQPYTRVLIKVVVVIDVGCQPLKKILQHKGLGNGPNIF
jgi:hypothetical protein